jgi:prepilin peptidase CpaA
MAPVSFLFLAGAAVVTALVACSTDIRSRRIPNLLTLGSALLAIAARLLLDGPYGAAQGLAGWLVGILLLLPLFALRGLGGGDVKLLGAFGAWVGAPLVVWSGLYGVLAGGVLAMILGLWHGALRTTFANISLLLTHWRVAGISPVDGLTLETSRSLRLAYAIPLTCGLMAALWLKH